MSRQVVEDEHHITWEKLRDVTEKRKDRVAVEVVLL